MTLLDSIQHAISLDMKVSFSRDVNSCVIDVEDKGETITQFLPLDNHMDYALPGCIDFCIKKHLKH